MVQATRGRLIRPRESADMSNLTNIVIGLVVVGLLLARQLQPRLAKESSSLRLVLVLGVTGLIEMESAIGHHTVPVATVAWLVLSLLAGAGMGAVRAVTVTIWRAEDGSAWRQGTKFTAALWLVSLAAHFALDALVEHSTRVPLGTSSILLYLAVTIGVQREIVRWRAARLTPRVAVDPLEEPHYFGPARRAHNDGNRLTAVPEGRTHYGSGNQNTPAAVVRRSHTDRGPGARTSPPSAAGPEPNGW